MTKNIIHRIEEYHGLQRMGLEWIPKEQALAIIQQGSERIKKEKSEATKNLILDSDDVDEKDKKSFEQYFKGYIDACNQNIKIIGKPEGKPSNSKGGVTDG